MNNDRNTIHLNFFEALGMMTTVAMMSHYSNWTLSDVEAFLIPALHAGQCKVYFDERGRPIAFITWALVDNECHEILFRHGKNPPANRWQSGGNLWFIDIVAPLGNTLHIVRDMQRNHFPHLHAHSIKRNPDGSVKRVKSGEIRLSVDFKSF